MVIDRAALNALTSQYAAQKADYDDSENRYRINYNSALDDMRRQQQKAVGNINVNMADHGLQQSGIAAQEQLTNQQDVNIKQQQMAQQQQLNLATIARKRLENDQAFNTQAPLL